MFKHCEPSFLKMSPPQFQKWAPWGPQWPIPRIKPGFLNTKPAVVNTDNKKSRGKQYTIIFEKENTFFHKLWPPTYSGHTTGNVVFNLTIFIFILIFGHCKQNL